ncbi:MAG: undecaprenyl-phosphate glucose phosphotransferase [Chloroflexi bacterium]|nr:undecaprenyl-phosphate glucose phosphotransferase [Chloroflexota bacterium]
MPATTDTGRATPHAPAAHEPSHTGRTALSAREPGASPRGPLLRLLYVVALVVNDILAVAVAFALGYAHFQVNNPRAAVTQPPLTGYSEPLALLVGAVVVTFALRRLYIPRRDISALDLLGSLALSASIASVVALAFGAFWARGTDVPRSILVWAWGGGILLMWLGRLALRALVGQLRRRGWDETRVLIVGAGPEGQVLRDRIVAAPELGYRVVGFLAEPGPDVPADLPVLGEPADLTQVIRAHHVGEVLVAQPSLSHQQLVELVGQCTRERVSIKVFPDFFQIMAAEVSTSELGSLPLLCVRDVTLRGWNRALKRAVDVVGSAVLLVLLAPLLLAIALLVKLTSPGGPVFFVQERLGLDDRPFLLLKFRSMRVDAEAGTGPVMARPDDDRTTPLGRLLRRFSLDELPQLINVLVGEMSLVGPRPERPHFVQQFEKAIPRYRDRHQEKAGMTGWAQVNGLRGRSSIAERTRYDLFYVEHWSLLFDLKILLSTVAAVFRGRNAY